MEILPNEIICKILELFKDVYQLYILRNVSRRIRSLLYECISVIDSHTKKELDISFIEPFKRLKRVKTPIRYQDTLSELPQSLIEIEFVIKQIMDFNFAKTFHSIVSKRSNYERISFMKKEGNSYITLINKQLLMRNVTSVFWLKEFIDHYNISKVVIIQPELSLYITELMKLETLEIYSSNLDILYLNFQNMRRFFLTLNFLTLKHFKLRIKSREDSAFVIRNRIISYTGFSISLLEQFPYSETLKIFDYPIPRHLIPDIISKCPNLEIIGVYDDICSYYIMNRGPIEEYINSYPQIKKVYYYYQEDNGYQDTERIVYRPFQISEEEFLKESGLF